MPDVSFNPSVDPHDLVGEWGRQGPMRAHWGRKLAEAKRRLNEAEAALAVEKAEMARAIWEQPGKYELPKVTVDAVAEAVLMSAECKLATKQVIDAKYAVDMATAALAAIDDRKWMLLNLVKLWEANYYGDNNLPPVGGEFGDQVKNHTRRLGQRDTEEVR